MKKKIAICTFALMLTFSPVSYAMNNCRCNHKIVSVGDGSFEILDKCGTPAFVANLVNTDVYGRPYVYGQKWTYTDIAPGFYTIFVFRNDRLQEIIHERR